MTLFVPSKEKLVSAITIILFALGSGFFIHGVIVDNLIEGGIGLVLLFTTFWAVFDAGKFIEKIAKNWLPAKIILSLMVLSMPLAVAAIVEKITWPHNPTMQKCTGVVVFMVVILLGRFCKKKDLKLF